MGRVEILVVGRDSQVEQSLQTPDAVPMEDLKVFQVENVANVGIVVADVAEAEKVESELQKQDYLEDIDG